MLQDICDKLAHGALSREDSLPYDIKRFPDIIRERIPACDPVIIAFMAEAIHALEANLLLSAAFLMGAASEKAIHLMIEAYGNSIADEKNQKRFKQRVSNNKVISAKYNEFKASYRSCQNPCDDLLVRQDLDSVLDSMFTFFRVTRNTVGHPQIVPNLDRGILIAKFGQFVTYIEKVYALTDYFGRTKIKV